MKKGDVLNGYVLTTDPQGGGGHSEWAFAQKDGEEYFLKRFLHPAYPLPDGPGSEKTKAYNRQRCENFQRQQRLVMRKLRPIAGEGGNLVVTKDFFRERAFFYKVTAKVDVSRISVRDIAAMDRGSRIFIMLTAAHSLDTLHKAGLVHGDVKPDNLLIKALGKGRFAINVIDFDNCFPAHDPPAADQLVGDPTFYSPELLRYTVGEAPGDQLDEKNDVFALGLVFWQYLTGERPELPGGVNYPAEAVSQGSLLSLPRSVEDRPLVDLVHSMLASGSGDRPGMSDVHNTLRTARKLDPAAPVPVREARVEPPRMPAKAIDGTLRIRPPKHKAAPPAEPGKADKKGLRGTLARLRATEGAPPHLVPHPDGESAGAPLADAPPPRLKGPLSRSRPEARPAGGPPGEPHAGEEKDREAKTSGKLRGRLLKKEE
jgi:eukaryotic-like serine/threonine-protein kinase